MQTSRSMLTSLIAALASGETFHAVRSVRRAAIVYLLVALLALVGLGFLVRAAYTAAADRMGPIAASLTFGGGFLVLALLILLVYRISAQARARSLARRRTTDLAAIGAAGALAALPTLLRGKGGLLAPALAVIAYAIYRENAKKPDGDKGERT
jgi:hypothetical protein